MMRNTPMETNQDINEIDAHLNLYGHYHGDKLGICYLCTGASLMGKKSSICRGCAMTRYQLDIDQIAKRMSPIIDSLAAKLQEMSARINNISVPRVAKIKYLKSVPDNTMMAAQG